MATSTNAATEQHAATPWAICERRASQPYRSHASWAATATVIASGQADARSAARSRR